MKKIYTYILTLLACLSWTGCNEWLEVYPQNDQVSDYYWTSKEDVEAVINSGYYYLRDMVIDELIPLGELRAGCIYSRYSNNLQTFRVKEDNSICNWGPFYEIINVANSVLANADKACERDDTYDVNVMNSHKSEAYFLRALSYFYLVRNWRDVPLILDPYETDANTYQVAKSSESEVIAQIKKDIETAVQSGGAKEQFEKAWENKGRATKWALCALMADVCLWSEDYETAITYCDIILNATSATAPRFMSSPTHASWFSMFNPGNSDESIFELQWDYEREQFNDLPILFDNSLASRTYEYTPTMLADFTQEYRYTQQNLLEAVRTMYGGYYVASPSSYETATNGFVWKYCGSTVLTDKRTSDHYDPNFIIYRVADVVLMKAEALVLKEENNLENWRAAVDLLNEVRLRSNLSALPDPEGKNEEEILTDVLYERKMELAGEGKYWYDLLRFGRRNNNRYKDLFLIGNVLDYNNQASTSWLRSVLVNEDALFLPIWESELKTNTLLEQNPYYN